VSGSLAFGAWDSNTFTFGQASYQGTTLVVPKRVQKHPGFTPCGIFFILNGHIFDSADIAAGNYFVSIGFTPPQSGPLKTDVYSVVHSTGAERELMVIVPVK